MWMILNEENDLEEKSALDNFVRLRICNFEGKNVISVCGVLEFANK
jgi:hypothetical protein